MRKLLSILVLVFAIGFIGCDDEGYDDGDTVGEFEEGAEGVRDGIREGAGAFAWWEDEDEVEYGVDAYSFVLITVDEESEVENTEVLEFEELTEYRDLDDEEGIIVVLRRGEGVGFTSPDQVRALVFSRVQEFVDAKSGVVADTSDVELEVEDDEDALGLEDEL